MIDMRIEISDYVLNIMNKIKKEEGMDDYDEVIIYLCDFYEEYKRSKK